MISRRLAVLAVLTAAAATRAAAAEPAAAGEFHRVHVPAGRIADVPLGGARHVPMPVTEFEAAVARAAARDGLPGRAAAAPLAASARYAARLDERGWLVGTVSCAVDAATVAAARSLPLGGLPVQAASRGSAAGRREAIVFGTEDGRLALDVSEPGTYLLEFAVPPRDAAGDVHRLPLVPALETVIDLDLPEDVRPQFSGAAMRAAVVTPPAAGATAWRIACGPAAALDVALAAGERPPVRIRTWARIRLGGAAAECVAACIPDGAWRSGTEVLETSPGFRVVDVRAVDDEAPLTWQAAADGRSVTITVPPWLDGRRTGVVIRGVMPAEAAAWKLPLLAPAAVAWAGGGMIVETEPAWAVAGIDATECRVVTPETAASWPVPPAAGRAAALEAVLHCEPQGPAATITVTVAAHAPTFDVARVTTLDVSPGAVLGRTACDVRVMHGAAFEIAARVAPGWIIDAVTIVEPDAADATGLGSRPGAAAEAAPDWRVVRGREGDVLRIGLADAATASRGIGLRVEGHRRGLPPGSSFDIADVDMVRFAGEAPDAAFLDFQLGSDAFVEIGGAPVGFMPLAGRAAALVEAGTPRGRIRAGERVPNRTARLVRRRPPLDARVRVAVELRAESLAQTYDFECRAAAGGIAAFVADFSEPMGDGLAWSLAAPGGSTVAARRIEAGEAPSRPVGVAESWLVELSPAVEETAVVRARRIVPFAASLTLPLAWVEAAVNPGGTVALADAGEGRLRVRTLGLRELATDLRLDGAANRFAEFAYGAPEPGRAVELEPAAGRGEARAWAWRETITCWCEESGGVEAESRFSLENLGRESVALTVPAGARLLEVVVDGVTVVDGDAAAAGGTVRVPLPPDRRRVEVLARALAAHGPILGWRRIDPPACGIDAPVFDRELRLLVPPRLEVAATAAAWRPVGGPSAPWTARLWGRAVADGGIESDMGFRVRRFAIAPGLRAAGIVIVHDRLLVGGAILTAAAILAGIWSWGARSPAAVAALASAAGMLALWAAPPFDGVARVAWWTALGGLVAVLGARISARSWLALSPRTAAVALVAAWGLSAAAEEGGWRVFITPGEPEATALVPEPLFRRLVAASAPAAAAIRVTDCRVVVPEDGGPEWRVELGLDADAGGTLVMDQGATGAVWVVTPQPPAGVLVAAEPAAATGGDRVRLTAAVAGRRRVAVGVRPGVARRGDVDVATVRLPLAPRASLVVAGPAEAGTVGCDRGTAGGPLLPAAPAAAAGGGVAFDVAGATEVRLVRPIDRRLRLAAVPRRAVTGNAVEWNLDAARVEATFDVDPGPDIVTGVTVRADERLADLAVGATDTAAARLFPLGGGTIRVEVTDPVRGPIRLRLVGNAGHPSPVGVFDLPGVWLDGVPDEVRSVSLAAAPELDAVLEPVPPAAATAAELATRPPSRVMVGRRRQRPRGVQALAAVFGPDRIGLELRAQIDAGPLALTQIPVEVPAGCVVDRVALVEEDLAAAPGRPPVVVDTVWARPTPEQLVAVVQEPRAGRFRLEVDARVATRAGDRGRLAVVRADLAGGAPLLVSWRSEPDVRVEVRPAAGGDAAATSVELREGDAAPDYEILPPAASTPEPAPVAGATEPLAGGPGRIERAETFLAFDARGRVRGAVRFDVSAAAPEVQLRLPAGLQLFDVVVDGAGTVAEPRGETWAVRLHDVRWPRSILALFAGELGPDAVDGAALTLAAPALEGLPDPEMLWTLRPPDGCDVAIAAPGQRLDAAALAARRDAAATAIEQGFAPALAAAEGDEFERLAALAEARRRGGAPAVEAAWERGLGWDRGSVARESAADVAAAATGGLTVRIVRRADATAPSRAAATAALAALGAVAWAVAARRRGRPAR